MDHLVEKLGMIGCSLGNGHPYSFSSIINGYDSFYLQQSGWDGINNYLNRKDKAEFGILGAQVTHVWTQDTRQTELLKKACFIPNAVSSFYDMIPEVDAVIIARDDYNSHLNLALPFLKEGIPVFVDKPLTVDLQELQTFLPFLKSGLLTSCSSFRYATELDSLPEKNAELGDIILYRGTILNDWNKYGIHMLEGFISRLSKNVVSVHSVGKQGECMLVYLDDGSVIQIQAMGEICPLFAMEWIGKKGYFRAEVRDNFVMFRRMLWHFISGIRQDIASIDYGSTTEILYTLIAGNISRLENREVYINEIRL